MRSSVPAALYGIDSLGDQPALIEPGSAPVKVSAISEPNTLNNVCSIVPKRTPSLQLAHLKAPSSRNGGDVNRMCTKIEDCPIESTRLATASIRAAMTSGRARV